MKQILRFALFLTLTLSVFSCNRPTCPAQENLHTKTDKKGTYKKSKTQSNLFPKEMRRQ